MKTKQTVWHAEKHQRFIPSEYGGPGGGYGGVNHWFWLIVHEDQDQPQLRTPIAEVTISTDDESHARLIAAAPTMYNYLTLLAEGGDDKAREIISKITGS